MQPNKINITLSTTAINNYQYHLNTNGLYLNSVFTLSLAYIQKSKDFASLGFMEFVERFYAQYLSFNLLRYINLR